MGADVSYGALSAVAHRALGCEFLVDGFFLLLAEFAGTQECAALRRVLVAVASLAACGAQARVPVLPNSRF